MIVNSKFLIFPLLASCFLVACDPGAPSGSDEFVASGYAKPLSQKEFNQLPPEQQYEVANKLLGTMFKGVNPEDFFDTSNGLGTLVPASKTFLTDLKKQLGVSLTADEVDATLKDIDGLDADGLPVEANAKYRFSNLSANRQRPQQRALAFIREYPVGKNQFVDWMAYFLSNTIMFSPATEMDAPNSFDANNMYYFLTTHLTAEDSVRQIVRSNLSTLARWRVSRSAENHALEAYELYLGKFNNTEADELNTYRGGIACKQYYLTSEADDYLLAYTGEVNTTPQLVLDTHYVTTCEDLYEVIAGHELLMPRVTEVIINYLMSGRSQEDRLRMNAAIVNSGPTTFQDIFTAILFSKEYLLNTERPKSFEENLFPMMDKLRWNPRVSNGSSLFIDMTNTGSSSRLKLAGMGWDTMTYKIGRLPDVPVDFKDFANYHKSMRENLLFRTGLFSGGTSAGGFTGLYYDENGDARPFIAGLSLNDFIDYLFLITLDRRATDVEKSDLTVMFNDPNGDSNSNDTYLRTLNGGLAVKPQSNHLAAQIAFDYISRLPEFYYFKAIN